MAEKKPTHVKIIDTEKPVPVTIEDKAKEAVFVDKNFNKSLAPDTTQQEDITKAGQRRINLIWEFTQAIIAVSITWAIVYCQINKINSEILNNAFFLIVTMYYVRTNHNLIGGVGPKTGTR